MVKSEQFSQIAFTIILKFVFSHIKTSLPDLYMLFNCCTTLKSMPYSISIWWAFGSGGLNGLSLRVPSCYERIISKEVVKNYTYKNVNWK